MPEFQLDYHLTTNAAIPLLAAIVIWVTKFSSVDGTPGGTLYKSGLSLSGRTELGSLLHYGMCCTCSIQ